MIEDSVFKKIKELYELIDNAPSGQDEFFLDETEKETYESSFTIAFRKYQGAQYHYRKVLNLYKVERQEAIRLLIETRKPSNTSFFGGLQMSHNADEYVYELSAFLASIKSCADFLSAASIPHLKGFEDMDSIKTLMKQVRKGKDECIFGVVKKYFNWLEEMRDYRHKIIHRTVILTKSSVVIRNLNNKSEVLIHSIFVPKKPPRNILDTRKSQQQFLEDFKDYDFKYSIDENRKINYDLPKGFSTIEDLMKGYLDMLAAFFIDFINQILTQGLKKCLKLA